MSKKIISDPSFRQTRKMKFSRKKRIIILIILAGASYGAIAYLHKDPDPTTWESMRTDYKNTK